MAEVCAVVAAFGVGTETPVSVVTLELPVFVMVRPKVWPSVGAPAVLLKPTLKVAPSPPGVVFAIVIFGVGQVTVTV